MTDDRRLTISSSSRLHPDEVARHTFGTARRGFDPSEVRAYLEQLARDMEAGAQRERELSEALAEAERRAANPVLDEATLTAALGQETARVLRSAHDAANELLARAEADASRVRAEAQDQAGQLQSRAEQNATDRITQVEAAATDLRRRVEEERAAKLESSKIEAEALVAQARAECRAMLQEAQELRTRVLADLTRRRRVLHSQIEQLRAGRERLAETIGDVRHTVDRITDELFRAEDEARLAAEAAGRQAAAQDESGTLTSVVVIGEDAAGTPPVIGDGPADDEASRKQAVDALFARLRAERHTGDGGDAAMTEADTSGEEDAGIEGRQASPTESRAAVRVLTSAPAPAKEAAPAASEQPSRTGTAPPGDGGHAEPASGEASSSDASRLERRDEMLTPVVSMLARRLKRALQDDQNDILDRVRALGGWGPDVLPAPEDHERRYAAAAAEPLTDAARSGAAFAGGKPDDAPVVDAVATELASAIVVPLRRRLDSAGGSTDVGDDAALVEHVGAAFRDWKGQRIERLAGDNALAAFSQAVLAVAPHDTALRWIVDDAGVQCPDCDDNALAGALRPGESYPTGHRCPPAHAGCRCLLAPAEA